MSLLPATLHEMSKLLTSFFYCYTVLSPVIAHTVTVTDSDTVSQSQKTHTQTVTETHSVTHFFFFALCMAAFYAALSHTVSVTDSDRATFNIYEIQSDGVTLIGFDTLLLMSL